MIFAKKLIFAFSFLAFFLFILSLTLVEVSQPQETGSRAKETASFEIQPSATSIPISCQSGAEPALVKEETSTEIKQELSTSWGRGNPLEFSAEEAGRIDRVDLYLSGDGIAEVKIVGQENEEKTETIAKQIVGQGWISFDFSHEGALIPGEKYTVNIRKSPQSISGTKINLHRGPFWQWAARVYFKPCRSATL